MLLGKDLHDLFVQKIFPYLVFWRWILSKMSDVPKFDYLQLPSREFGNDQVKAAEAKISLARLVAYHLFLFRYWRYNEEMRTMDPGYPKPITVWRGVPDSPQGAFVDKANGKICPAQYSDLAAAARLTCQAALISAGHWHTLYRSDTSVMLIQLCPSYYTES